MLGRCWALLLIGLNLMPLWSYAAQEVFHPAADAEFNDLSQLFKSINDDICDESFKLAAAHVYQIAKNAPSMDFPLHSEHDALIKAINNNKIKKIRRICDKQKDSFFDIQNAERGGTALHQAARIGFFDATQALVAAKADIDQQDIYGDSSLFAAVEGGRRDVLTFLLNFTPNRMRNKWGRGLLHAAVITEKLELARLLVEDRELEVDEPDSYGVTPLGYAMMTKNQQMIDMLKQNGAKVPLKEGKDRSGIDRLEKNKLQKGVSQQKSEKKVDRAAVMQQVEQAINSADLGQIQHLYETVPMQDMAQAATMLGVHGLSNHERIVRGNDGKEESLLGMIQRTYKDKKSPVRQLVESYAKRKHRVGGKASLDNLYSAVATMTKSAATGNLGKIQKELVDKGTCESRAVIDLLDGDDSGSSWQEQLCENTYDITNLFEQAQQAKQKPGISPQDKKEINIFIRALEGRAKELKVAAKKQLQQQEKEGAEKKAAMDQKKANNKKVLPQKTPKKVLELVQQEEEKKPVVQEKDHVALQEEDPVTKARRLNRENQLRQNQERQEQAKQEKERKRKVEQDQKARAEANRLLCAEKAIRVQKEHEQRLAAEQRAKEQTEIAQKEHARAEQNEKAYEQEKKVLHEKAQQGLAAQNAVMQQVSKHAEEKSNALPEKTRADQTRGTSVRTRALRGRRSRKVHQEKNKQVTTMPSQQAVDLLLQRGDVHAAHSIAQIISEASAERQSAQEFVQGQAQQQEQVSFEQPVIPPFDQGAYVAGAEQMMPPMLPVIPVTLAPVYCSHNPPVTSWLTEPVVVPVLLLPNETITVTPATI